MLFQNNILILQCVYKINTNTPKNYKIMNKQAQAIEKAIASLEKEMEKVMKGEIKGLNYYSFELGNALIYLRKAKEEAEKYNYETLKK